MSRANGPARGSAEAAIQRAVALHADAEQRREAGDQRGAARAAGRALVPFERHAGRAHPDVAAALLALGAALELADRWREALAHYERADRLLARCAGLRNPEIRRLRAKTARALSGVLRALGRYDDAELHARRPASSTGRGACGPAHPSTRAAAENVARLNVAAKPLVSEAELATIVLGVHSAGPDPGADEQRTAVVVNLHSSRLDPGPHGQRAAMVVNCLSRIDEEDERCRFDLPRGVACKFFHSLRLSYCDGPSLWATTPS
jgi:hypothetical protein